MHEPTSNTSTKASRGRLASNHISWFPLKLTFFIKKKKKKKSYSILFLNITWYQMDKTPFSSAYNYISLPLPWHAGKAQLLFHVF